MPIPEPPTVILALGSNLGDSVRLLRQARHQLQSLSTLPVRASSLWQTEPVACPPGSPPFLNAVLRLVPFPSESPRSCLRKLQAMEQLFGRRPRLVPNEPRPLDLDLIAWDGLVLEEPDLILPHPRAHQRRFVLAPLAELDPNFVLPGQTRTVGELLAGLTEPEEARRLDVNWG